ncbi:MAG: hypothetical protein K8U03_02510 [Planctomycetia bacterium]|nr:hypothetical protein [Planctomycetia bacterium]
MQHRVFRITGDDIEDLRDRIRDEVSIASWDRWLQNASELDPLVRRIEAAFAGQTLDDGIGLLEAQGLDDYAGASELAELRSRDEDADWRRIDSETLNHCYAAPTYLDARGFVFHLPAFLIAELSDTFHYGFIDRLVSVNRAPSGWIDLLTTTQRDSLVDTLKLVSLHPSYHDRSADITIAIDRLRGTRDEV